MAKRFIQYFEDSFKENWDLPAMTNYVTKQTHAYKDVAREVAKLHILFREMNIQQDDKIALVGNNTPEWAITFLATITYGAVIVPILQDFHPDDVAHIIEHSESKLLFVGDTYWDRLEEKDTSTLRAVFSLSDFRCVRQLQGETLHLLMRQLPTLYKERYPQGVQREDVRYAEKDDQEMCVLNYTSGTTGFSKGVMLKGDNFCCLFEYSAANHLGEKGDKVIAMLPLAHAYGCVNDLFYPFIVGGHITFMPQMPSSKTLLQAMKEVKPDYISIVPMVMEAIYKKNILPKISKFPIKLTLGLPFVSSIVGSKIRKQLMNTFGGAYKNLFIAGAGLDKEVEHFLVKIKFPYTLAYGMTECSPIVSLNCHELTPYSVGRPINGILVKIDSKDPYSIPGELLVKGRNVMKGYYKDEEATRKMFTEKDWLKTGDMGVMDKHGNLYIKGRCKNMILTSSGQNVYPEEIEAKLNASVWVAESLVLQRENKIVALVLPDWSMINKANITSDDVSDLIETLRKEVNRSLPPYEYIYGIDIQTKEFEKTPKKSIKRYLYE